MRASGWREEEKTIQISGKRKLQERAERERSVQGEPYAKLLVHHSNHSSNHSWAKRAL